MRVHALVALTLAVVGCASTPPSGFRIDPDRAVGDAVAATARAVAGRDVSVVVHMGHAVRAELRPDHSVHVWRGLLLRTPDASELAFALAHELAHEALAHSFPEPGAARDVAQELAADSRARDAITAAGFDREAGASLLRALREEASVMGADTAAIAELDRRLAALHGEPASYSVRGDEPWHTAWAERRAGWLAGDPASADPRRIAVLQRHAEAALEKR